jgi:hypothetical protein
MAKLYRNTTDPQHWLVFSDDLGWVRFPAKVGGWADCRPICAVARQSLQPVPIRLAFNTGLIESLRRRGLDRAA